MSLVSRKHIKARPDIGAIHQYLQGTLIPQRTASVIYKQLCIFSKASSTSLLSITLATTRPQMEVVGMPL